MSMFSKLKNKGIVIHSEWRPIRDLKKNKDGTTQMFTGKSGDGSDAVKLTPINTEVVAYWRIQDGLLQIWKETFTEEETKAFNDCAVPESWKWQMKPIEVESMESAMRKSREKRGNAPTQMLTKEEAGILTEETLKTGIDKIADNPIQPDLTPGQ